MSSFKLTNKGTNNNIFYYFNYINEKIIKFDGYSNLYELNLNETIISIFDRLYQLYDNDYDKLVNYYKYININFHEMAYLRYTKLFIYLLCYFERNYIKNNINKSIIDVLIKTNLIVDSFYVKKTECNKKRIPDNFDCYTTIFRELQLLLLFLLNNNNLDKKIVLNLPCVCYFIKHEIKFLNKYIDMMNANPKFIKGKYIDETILTNKILNYNRMKCIIQINNLDILNEYKHILDDLDENFIYQIINSNLLSYDISYNVTSYIINKNKIILDCNKVIFMNNNLNRCELYLYDKKDIDLLFVKDENISKINKILNPNFKFAGTNLQWVPYDTALYNIINNCNLLLKNFNNIDYKNVKCMYKRGVFINFNIIKLDEDMINNLYEIYYKCLIKFHGPYNYVYNDYNDYNDFTNIFMLFKSYCDNHHQIKFRELFRYDNVNNIFDYYNINNTIIDKYCIINMVVHENKDLKKIVKRFGTSISNLNYKNVKNVRDCYHKILTDDYLNIFTEFF